MSHPDAWWIAMAHFAAAWIVLISLLVSLVRVFRGPTPVERLLAAQLMGTAGVAVVLLMGAGMQHAGRAIPGFVDVALVFAMLAGMAGVAFVRRGWESRVEAGDEESGNGPAT